MRDNSVTIAKGITIMLMVMGHAGCPSWINDYLYMLRMPLFFFMSGYCFKLKYLDDYKTFMSKRIKGIYKPYVKWSVFFLLMHNIFYYLNIYNETYSIFGNPTQLYTWHDFSFHFYRLLVPMDGYEPLTGVYWFLKSLFWGSIIFYLTRKWIKDIKICILLLFIISMMFSYFHIAIPIFNIGAKSFLASLFIMLGHFYKSENVEIKKTCSWILTYATVVGIGAYFCPTSMLTFNHINLLPYVICALIGTLMIFGISKRIINLNIDWLTNLLVYIGNHTFNVLTWHLLSFKIVSLIIIFIYNLDITHLAERNNDLYASQGWWIVYFIFGNAVPLIWLYYYSKLKKQLNERQ